MEHGPFLKRNNSSSLFCGAFATLLILSSPAHLASAQSPTSSFGISLASVGGDTVAVHFQTQSGHNYRVEYKSSLSDPNWTALQTVAGTDGGYWIADPGSPGASQRLYRVAAGASPPMYSWNLVGYSRFHITPPSTYVSSPIQGSEFAPLNQTLSALLTNAPDGTMVSQVSGSQTRTYFLWNHSWHDEDTGNSADGVWMDLAKGFSVYPSAPFTLTVIGEPASCDSSGIFSNARAVLRPGTRTVDFFYDLARDMPSFVLQASTNQVVWMSIQSAITDPSALIAGTGRSFSALLPWTPSGTVWLRFTEFGTSAVYTCPFACNAASAPGSLRANLSPVAAVSAGAHWSVDGGDWHDTGQTVFGLTAGLHGITFQSVSGWLAPPSQSVTVMSGQETVAIGTYQRLTELLPRITAQPQNQTTVPGRSVTFSVSAVGTPPLSYLWKKGGTQIPGATGALLTLNSVGASDAGSYCVTVMNAYGSTTSPDAKLEVQQGRLELRGIEVTQTCQDLCNSVPLIAGKRTMARAVVYSTVGLVMNVSSRLAGYRNGVPLPGSPLQAIDASKPVANAPNRAGAPFEYDLPPEWCSGTIELEFQSSSHPFAFMEPDATPDGKVTVTFVEGTSIDVCFVKVIWKDWSGIPHVPSQELAQEQLLAALPISNIYSRPCITYSWPTPWAPDGLSLLKIDAQLEQDRKMDIAEGRADAQTYYIAIVADFDTGVAGAATPKSILTDAYVLTSFITPDRCYSSIAHEFGHLCKRPHTCYTSLQDPLQFEVGCRGHLPPNGTISPTIEPFDISTVIGINCYAKGGDHVYGPETPDVMSYGLYSWPSPFTYTNILKELLRRHPPGATGRNLPQAKAPVEAVQLFIAGVVSLTNDFGSIVGARLVNTDTDPTAPMAGDFCVTLLGPGNTALGQFPFSPNVSDDATIGTFDLNIPWADGAVEVQIRNSATLLDRRLLATNDCQLRVLRPMPGEMFGSESIPVAWQSAWEGASYSLYYSVNGGGAWQPVAAGLSTTNYLVEPGVLGASTQAMFKVMASWGVSSAVSQSLGTFFVGNQVPEVAILSPHVGATFSKLDSILLTCAAYDAEDCRSPALGIRWFSDRAGPLGAGSRLRLPPGRLAEGAHVISATVTDSGGSSQSSSVEISVGKAVDLTFNSTLAPTFPVVGSNLVCTITVENLGPESASGVTLTNPLPKATVFVSSSASQGNCSEANGLVTCDLGAVTNRGVVVVTILFMATTNGTITNTLGVTCNEMDINPINNSGTQTAVVLAADQPPLSVSMQPTDQVLLLWPTWATISGFVLQRADGLQAPGSWKDAAEIPAPFGEMLAVTNSTLGTNRFYRLKKANL